MRRNRQSLRRLSAGNESGIRVISSPLFGDHHQVQFPPHPPVHPRSPRGNLAWRGVRQRFRYGGDPVERTARFVPAHEKQERSAQGCGHALAMGTRSLDMHLPVDLEIARKLPPAGSSLKESEQYTRWLARSEEHTSELQSRLHLVCRLLL